MSNDLRTAFTSAWISSSVSVLLFLEHASMKRATGLRRLSIVHPIRLANCIISATSVVGIFNTTSSIYPLFCYLWRCKGTAFFWYMQDLPTFFQSFSINQRSFAVFSVLGWTVYLFLYHLSGIAFRFIKNLLCTFCIFALSLCPSFIQIRLARHFRERIGSGLCPYHYLLLTG